MTYKRLDPISTAMLSLDSMSTAVLPLDPISTAMLQGKTVTTPTGISISLRSPISQVLQQENKYTDFERGQNNSSMPSLNELSETQTFSAFRSPITTSGDFPQNHPPCGTHVTCFYDKPLKPFTCGIDVNRSPSKPVTDIVLTKNYQTTKLQEVPESETQNSNKEATPIWRPPLVSGPKTFRHKQRRHR